MNGGLNFLRFFLATNVIAFHLWNAAAPGAGPVAVLGFFFISGFLITQIVQQVYVGPGHAGPYLLNRALRIYPQYAAALAFGLFTIWLYPDVAYHVNTYLRWPETAGEWLPQFSIVGLDDSNVRVLPASWTLGTELYFYMVIGLFTARSRSASVALCAVTLPVGALCAWGVLPFTFYGSPIGNAFVFAVGSLAFFWRDAVRVGTPLFLVACAAYLAQEYGIPALDQSDLNSANLSGSVLPLAVIVLYLVQNDIRSAWLASVSNVLGKIAYPMFLIHWAVCVVISALAFDGLASTDMHGTRAGGEYFIVMFAGVVACSLVFYLLIDRPVEVFRRRIRRNAIAH